MAVKLRAETRNARLNAIETFGGVSCALRVYTGAPPADCTAANSGTLLATLLLPADWMQDASGGSKAKSVAAWTVVASGGAADTPGNFRLYNSQATMDGTTCIAQGTCAIGSGDLSFDGTITAGQTVTVGTFTLTDGNA
jgi:hypothetical protein